MHKKLSGFTIVELLIVIVVIAILAAISIVAYNGIQQRAKNTQTHQAVTAWIKAINLYRQANDGKWPPGTNWVCLGEGYKWGPTGVVTAGAAPNNTQCGYSSGGSGLVQRSDFNTAMSSFVGSSMPTPAMVTAYVSDTDWSRGIMFTNSGGSGNAVSMRVVYAGSIACPGVPLVISVNSSVKGGNTYCTYNMGLVSDPF